MKVVHELGNEVFLRNVEKFFPWIYEKNQNMIVHSDFDGIMSSMLLHEVNNWNLIGFYDLECIWFDEQLSSLYEDKLLEVLKSSIWVDADIYHEEIRSIGHHILKFRDSDQIPGHSRSLNPNLLRGIYHKDFNRKYPLGTVHFLMMLLKYKPRESELTELLLWHPNSSLANSQHYRTNVEDWLKNFLNIDFMIKTFPNTLTKSFEERMMKEVYPKLQNIGFDPGRAQITTLNLKLRGYQCAFNDPTNYVSKLGDLIKFIGEVMGWKELKIPIKYKSICGKRKNITYQEIRDKFGNLDSFLEKEKVFSYSIPNRGQVNYTIMPAIK
jgi:hypothetical protein